MAGDEDRAHPLRSGFQLQVPSHDSAALLNAVLRALDALNATPERVVFFDDFAANVAGAQAIGIAAYHVNSDGVPRQ
jgi:hypothetical protein